MFFKMKQADFQKKLINMDETRVELENPFDKTIELKGAKKVPGLTTNSNKIAYTIGLTVMDDGSKFPPFIILPGSGKQKIKRLITNSSIIQFNKK